MVPQNSYIFDDTIKANIKAAKHDATDREVEDACRKAAIHDTIITRQDGYDSKTGKNGE